jgi:hypothetical protein
MLSSRDIVYTQKFKNVILCVKNGNSFCPAFAGSGNNDHGDGNIILCVYCKNSFLFGECRDQVEKYTYLKIVFSYKLPLFWLLVANQFGFSKDMTFRSTIDSSTCLKPKIVNKF